MQVFSRRIFPFLVSVPRILLASAQASFAIDGAPNGKLIRSTVPKGYLSLRLPAVLHLPCRPSDDLIGVGRGLAHFPRLDRHLASFELEHAKALIPHLETGTRTAVLFACTPLPVYFTLQPCVMMLDSASMLSLPLIAAWRYPIGEPSIGEDGGPMVNERPVKEQLQRYRFK